MDDLYEYLVEAGAGSAAVDFSARVMLREAGCLVTDEAAALVLSDLKKLEEDGLILLGEATATGQMVMLILPRSEAAMLSNERLILAHERMSATERAMLREWESKALAGDARRSTSDWPGWPVIFKWISH